MREQSPEEQESACSKFRLDSVPYRFCLRVKEEEGCGGRATERTRKRRGAAPLGVVQTQHIYSYFLSDHLD